MCRGVPLDDVACLCAVLTVERMYNTVLYTSLALTEGWSKALLLFTRVAGGGCTTPSTTVQLHTGNTGKQLAAF